MACFVARCRDFSPVTSVDEEAHHWLEQTDRLLTGHPLNDHILPDGSQAVSYVLVRLEPGTLRLRYDAVNTHNSFQTGFIFFLKRDINYHSLLRTNHSPSGIFYMSMQITICSCYSLTEIIYSLQVYVTRL